MRLVVSSRVLRSRVLGLLFGGVLAATWACGGKSQQPSGSGGAGAAVGTGGSSGASPSAGVGATTGGAGTGGKGGSGAGAGGTAGTSAGGAGAGDGGASGSGGTSGASGDGGLSSGGTATGGTAGAAGALGFSYPECMTSDDCMLESDCCGCRSVPRDGREFCALDCVLDPCPGMGLAAGDVECVQGRCVLARSCTGAVTCPALPQACPEGTVPSVVDECWGPCLPPTDCRFVNGCEDCGDAFCVEFQGMRSTFSCVTRVEECDRENYCECLGVCGVCTEADDAVACPCLGC